MAQASAQTTKVQTNPLLKLNVQLRTLNKNLPPVVFRNPKTTKELYVYM